LINRSEPGEDKSSRARKASKKSAKKDDRPLISMVPGLDRTGEMTQRHADTLPLRRSNTLTPGIQMAVTKKSTDKKKHVIDVTVGEEADKENHPSDIAVGVRACERVRPSVEKKGTPDVRWQGKRLNQRQCSSRAKRAREEKGASKAAETGSVVKLTRLDYWSQKLHQRGVKTGIPKKLKNMQRIRRWD